MSDETDEKSQTDLTTPFVIKGDPPETSDLSISWVFSLVVLKCFHHS